MCPECRQAFQVATTGITAAVPQPKIAAAVPEAAPASSIVIPSSNRGLVIGVVASILLVGAGIITAIALTRGPAQPEPTQPPISAAKEKDETPKTDSTKDADKDKRRDEFIRLMIAGGTSLNSKHYEDAVSAYTDAAKLFPDDAEVKQRLSDAQSFLSKERDAKQEQDKRRDDALLLVQKGKGAQDEKKYAAAVEFFKLALQKDPSVKEASDGLVAAQAALDRDQLDQKKVAEFEQLIASGKAAMKANRFADAIRDFINAQRVIPNDPIAMQLQREAEVQLDGLMNRAERMKEFQRLLDQANTSLRSKAYEDAEKGFQRALRLFPGDPGAQQGLADARKGLKTAKADFTIWMAKGNAAAASGLFADAAAAFREASRLFPNDETASRALRQAELARDNQATYAQAIARAVTAMEARRYADAVVAYNDALRLLPGDAAALLGLQDAQRALDAELVRRRDFDRRASLGLQFLKAQKYSEAAVEFRAALKILPRDPQADIVRSQLRYAEAMGRGIAALNARRYAEAITDFQAALAEFPNDFAATSGLNKARALNKGGKG
jgi:tetratricopeptide (TPR) repeat protein